MNCYICEKELVVHASWRDLFFMDKAETICPACKDTFLPMESGCPICGASGAGVCAECTRWETTEFRALINSGKCLYAYNDAMTEFLHQYKFLQDVILAEVFAEELAAALKKRRAVVVPIPMNPLKLKARTFAQVDTLLDAGGVKYVHLLEKNEEVQGEKTKLERMETRGLFTWNGKPVPKQIVLVDDMYTTGTTLRLAAKVLKEAGAEDITFICLIRA